MRVGGGTFILGVYIVFFFLFSDLPDSRLPIHLCSGARTNTPTGRGPQEPHLRPTQRQGTLTYRACAHDSRMRGGISQIHPSILSNLNQPYASHSRQSSNN
ncbi:hypothetical protein BDZ97DRAFT_1846349 [Flammula alnicola]|nr:hypothetical protein BDZ97DRAFT_1846349 [Flammula alnicola]